MRVVLPLLVAAACLLPALASEPWGPMDCSDWIAAVPGLTCAKWEQRLPYGTNHVQDNETNLLTADWHIPNGVGCADGESQGLRIRRFSIANDAWETIGEIPARCLGADGDVDHYMSDVVMFTTSEPSMVFDEENGRLFLNVASTCTHDGGAYEPWTRCEYGPQYWLMVIEGFTTTFEILQSYEFTSSTLGFRVPYMPEGFQYASYFDTYYGALTNPIDFSAAQPLHCGYPATAPSVGDYLAVDDPLPDPPVNTGRYYVTAVNYMGQRRYGRQNNGGVLSGRNPANLPACDN